MDSPSDSSASAFPDTPSEIRVFSDFITPPETKQECHPHGSTNRSQDLTSYNSLIQSPSYPIPSNFLRLRNPSISAPLWLCLCVASDWLSHLRNASPFNSFGFSLYYSGYILLTRYDPLINRILSNFRLCPPPSDVFALPAYAPSGLESETPDHVPHTLQYVSPMSSGFTPIHPKLEAPDLFVGFLDEGLHSTPYLRSATAQSFSHVLHPLSIIHCPPCISRSLRLISVPELNTPDIRKPP
ncbi:hypothetical protein F4604DRAFT_1938448 [Suillus subluteus]|nr:hypothetical protein F4604DRAFT_1938448 [Suillus subluteus]